jgi:hypothetical protein
MIIENIRSYPPNLEVVSPIRNLRTRQAVVTKDPANVECLEDGKQNLTVALC